MSARKPDGSNRNTPRDGSPLRDIAPVIEGWPYESGTLNVRKIVGLDGRPKLQMRLDLGLLQMEVDGRPDGARPHGHDSLLDYHEQQLATHKRSHGTTDGYHLTPRHCQQLREEGVQYYHRYLSLFVLGEFDAVVRDTARNLRLLDLCQRFAVDENDRMVLEQYRPYIVMMNTRAAASIQMRNKQYADALQTVRRGLKSIKQFFRKVGQLEAYRHAGEVRTLKRFGNEIRKKMPVDPMEQLQKQLDKAIRAERYEEAARLRDEITRLADQKTV
ncbi:MAG TPA: UvrB/UvrC motif-containing protein [Tepidisphaeraceae bacterium]|nr:UvrB/UvrC motif-containing protein [Tepidisphaeraceae bacterium]